MRSCLLVIALTSLLGTAGAVGTEEIRQFFSPSLQETREVWVYLPEGYDPAGLERYPVIYFLHGANCSHTDGYEYTPSILDDLITAGTIEPVIMVRPDGSGCPWGGVNGCSWTNSELQGAFEDYVVYDVVGFADSAYRTVPSAAKRALMGHSMGAFGAMHAALKHPDVFGSVAAHSGYLLFDDFGDLHVPELIAEQQGPAPWEWEPIPVFTQLWFLFAGGFSPHPGFYPHEVDFPLDEWGVIIPSVWACWLEHDPARLAAGLTPSAAPAIYFDCGTNDELLFYPMNVHLHQYLSDLEIPHEAQFYAGGHYQQLPERFPVALGFLDDALRDPSGVQDPDVQGTPRVMQFRSGNPFIGQAAIFLSLPKKQWLSLRVHDVAGRLVAALMDGNVAAGESDVVWDATACPSGVYFCRLAAGSHRESRTLVLLR